MAAELFHLSFEKGCQVLSLFSSFHSYCIVCSCSLFDEAESPLLLLLSRVNAEDELLNVVFLGIVEEVLHQWQALGAEQI